MFAKNLIRGFSTLMALSAPTLLCADKKKQKIYMWGNGVYQARPDAIMQFKNLQPKQIKNLPDNIKHIEMGEFYDAGIDSNGKLIIWDKAVIDSSVSDEKNDCYRQNIRTLQKSGIKEVKFTQGYIWAITDSGKVYQWAIIKKFDDDKNIIDTKVGERR